MLACLCSIYYIFENAFLYTVYFKHSPMKTLTTDVLIIGGGATGTALARDLSIRGLKCLLLEKSDINCGASGANHGLLHSGARYVYSDAEAAMECARESSILKTIASRCIEETGGLFAGIPADDEAYMNNFADLCSKSNIEAQELTPNEALEREPELTQDLVACYWVNDASIDPFKLSLEMMNDAVQLGSSYCSRCEVVGFKKKAGIESTLVKNNQTGELFEVSAKLVVNAAGAWAPRIASLAGIELDMIYSKGSLLVTHHRMTSAVINRLRPPSDADIIVPGGTVSILGTTSIPIEKPEDIRPTALEAELILDECSAVIPALANTRIVRAYAGVRPLFGNMAGNDSRSVSRGFALLDHGESGADNLITITGGKLTTCRLMAEKTADLVCDKLGLDVACQTHRIPLGEATGNRWTEPGLSAAEWIRGTSDSGQILCDCEMVSEGSIRSIVELMRQQGQIPTLKSISQRSRMGKGACQGIGCSLRVATFLYQEGVFEKTDGKNMIQDFLENRWKGLNPVIAADVAGQVELQEALLCGVFGLDES